MNSDKTIDLPADTECVRLFAMVPGVDFLLQTVHLPGAMPSWHRTPYLAAIDPPDAPFTGGEVTLSGLVELQACQEDPRTH